MAEHTPGPWVANVYRTGRFVDRPEATIYAHSDTEELHIEALVAERVTAPKDEEVEANARLIAAAPELLEACQYLCAETHNRSSIDSEAFEQGVRLAEAIIAKAKNPKEGEGA